MAFSLTNQKAAQSAACAMPRMLADNVFDTSAGMIQRAIAAHGCAIGNKPS
jgi:hypothetical protein